MFYIDYDINEPSYHLKILPEVGIKRTVLHAYIHYIRKYLTPGIVRLIKPAGWIIAIPLPNLLSC